MSLLQIKDISMSFGSVKALDGVNLEIDEGTVLGLVGDNGAGKSTTMKIICCYINPTSGEVIVNENSIKKSPIKIKSELGYLPENNPLYEEMYVREFLGFIAQIHKIKDVKKAVNDVIEKVGLTKEAHKKIEKYIRFNNYLINIYILL